MHKKYNVAFQKKEEHFGKEVPDDYRSFKILQVQFNPDN